MRRTRLKITFGTLLFLAITSWAGMILSFMKSEIDFSTIVTTAIAGILTVATIYIGGDSYRKSNQEN